MHEEGLEFGERLLWRKHRSDDMNVVLDARWRKGVWLCRVAVDDEVLEVRAVQRWPPVERRCRECFGSIRAVPRKNWAPPVNEVPLVVLPPQLLHVECAPATPISKRGGEEVHVQLCKMHADEKGCAKHTCLS